MTGQTISHFEILDRIGKGGMGVVYKARDLELDRMVAVKFLVEEIGGEADAVERFMREAKAASSLDHPNICTIHEIGRTEDGSLFIVMALYGSETLRARMDAGLSIDEAIDVAAQIGRGLGAAHERSIVHRDVKPSNVVLTERGRAVILDFGLATLPGVLAVTKTGSTVGTAPYMSPEQLRGSHVDGRSDIWSLGVLLYEMVNGRRPFDGAYEQAVSYAIVNQDPEPGRTDGDPRLEGLNNIVMRCLSKEPDARYQDANEMVSDLEALSGVNASRAQTESVQTSAPAEQPSRTGFGRMLGLGAALLAVLALVFGIFMFGSGSGPDQASERRPVLLILPFENLGNADDAVFATGVSDEINGRLSTLSSLSVISRRSAKRFAETEKSTAEIGTELGVDYILEGQVRWARQSDGESQVRISPALIRVSDDTQLWAESYDRGIDDIFSIQADVATRVAAELDTRLSSADRDLLAEAPTASVPAYEAFLRGRALYWAQDFRAAAIALNDALALDPGFVQAAYMLARTYSWDYRANPEDRGELGPLAAEATARVARLAPDSPESHLASGFLQYYVERNFSRALEDFDIAVAARPGDDDALSSRAYLLRRLGRFEEATRDLHRAMRIDPDNDIYLSSTANTHYWMRQFDVADSLFSLAVKVNPLRTSYSCRLILNRLAWNGLSDDLINRAASLPLDVSTLACTMYGVDMMQRNYEKILVDLDALDENQPPNILGYILRIKGVTNRYAGKKESELAAWKDLESLAENAPVALRNDPNVLATLAVAKAGLGDKDAVVALVDTVFQLMGDDRLSRLLSSRSAAQIHTLAGNKDLAIEILRADLDSEFGIMTAHHLESPHWDALRDEPEFKALLE